MQPGLCFNDSRGSQLRDTVELHWLSNWTYNHTIAHIKKNSKSWCQRHIGRRRPLGEARIVHGAMHSASGKHGLILFQSLIKVLLHRNFQR